MVVTGDFMQLPPVVQGNDDPAYAFQASSWRLGIKRMLSLTTVCVHLQTLSDRSALC